jgi:hypothetical protein
MIEGENEYPLTLMKDGVVILQRRVGYHDFKSYLMPRANETSLHTSYAISVIEHRPY